MNTDNLFIQVKGLSFIEFSGSRPHLLTELFEKMGLKKGGETTEKPMSLYYQGDIRFISNPSSGGNAETFRSVHYRGACAMGFKVDNSEQAYTMALERGAKAAERVDHDIPAIQGVGKSIIYLVDDQCEQALFDQFSFVKDTSEFSGETALHRVDHLTHNLYTGGVEPMCQFYENLFGFIRIRSFHIEGKKTGLYSEVVASRCGKVIIPLNESKDDKSQIAEYIREYNGEGIQHIALLSTDLFSTVGALSDKGILFQDTPDAYYDQINDRLPGHSEDIEHMREKKILIDGGEEQGGGFLLQIFTKNSIGPIFFEYIQRKGNDGFGEGNFQALFDSIELDQERRGVLT